MKSSDIFTDFVTDVSVPNIGAEVNRQRIERFLVLDKGYDKSEIIVNAKISFEINGLIYKSFIDLIVLVQGKAFLAVKCAAGSLDSRSREIISGARLYSSRPVPVCAVSDGEKALIFNTMTGKRIGDSIYDIPSKNDRETILGQSPSITLSIELLEKEKLIFASYDSMNINLINKF